MKYDVCHCETAIVLHAMAPPIGIIIIYYGRALYEKTTKQKEDN